MTHFIRKTVLRQRQPRCLVEFEKWRPEYPAILKISLNVALFILLIRAFGIIGEHPEDRSVAHRRYRHGNALLACRVTTSSDLLAVGHHLHRK